MHTVDSENSIDCDLVIEMCIQCRDAQLAYALIAEMMWELSSIVFWHRVCPLLRLLTADIRIWFCYCCDRFDHASVNASDNYYDDCDAHF